MELAATVPPASLTSWLDQLIDLLTKRNRVFRFSYLEILFFFLVSSSTVEKTLLINVIQELRAQLSNDSQFASSFYSKQFLLLFYFSSEALFSVLNAFSIPKFIYSRSMKKFIGYFFFIFTDHDLFVFSCRKEIDSDLFGNARTRSEVFWERYDLLSQVRFYF